MSTIIAWILLFGLSLTIPTVSAEMKTADIVFAVEYSDLVDSLKKEVKERIENLLEKLDSEDTKEKVKVMIHWFGKIDTPFYTPKDLKKYIHDFPNITAAICASRDKLGDSGREGAIKIIVYVGSAINRDPYENLRKAMEPTDIKMFGVVANKYNLLRKMERVNTMHEERLSQFDDYFDLKDMGKLYGKIRNLLSPKRSNGCQRKRGDVLIVIERDNELDNVFSEEEEPLKEIEKDVVTLLQKLNGWSTVNQVKVVFASNVATSYLDLPSFKNILIGYPTEFFYRDRKLNAHGISNLTDTISYAKDGLIRYGRKGAELTVLYIGSGINIATWDSLDDVMRSEPRVHVFGIIDAKRDKNGFYPPSVEDNIKLFDGFSHVGDIDHTFIRIRKSLVTC